VRELFDAFLTAPDLFIIPADGVPEVLGEDDGSPAARPGVALTGRRRRGDGLPRLPRHCGAHELLAVSLGVSADALSELSDADVATALSRLRQLVGRVDDLEARAAVDDLTGVMRRGPGLAMLHGEVERAHRLDVGLVAVFLDVDGLKAVNDREGHAAGDDLLRAVGEALRKRLRSYDLVFRYGGDEFAAALLGTTLPEARAILADVRRCFASATGGQKLSVGLATLQHGETAEALLGRADAALYAGRARRRAGAV